MTGRTYQILKPWDLTIAHGVGIFAVVLVTGMSLLSWPPSGPQIIMSLVVLAVGCHRALLWNPVVALAVDHHVVALQFRRGQQVVLHRGDIVSISDHGRSKSQALVGLRITTRSGQAFIIATDARQRIEVGEALAQAMELYPLDTTPGYRRWGA